MKSSITPAPTKGVLNTRPLLPNEGYVRLPTVLAVFPVGRSTWWQGVADGRYPAPVKLAPRISAWRVKDIRALISLHAGLPQTDTLDSQPEKSGLAEAIRQGKRQSKPKSTRKSFQDVGPIVDDGNSSSSSSSSYFGTSSTASSKADISAEVEVVAFLDWWSTNYPAHNGGAVTTTNIRRDGPLVAELLKKRSRQRLEAMAEVLWTISFEEDAFIHASDRSLKILRHAADRLDRHVVVRQRRIGGDKPDKKRELNGRAAQIARIIARLEHHTHGEIGMACATVAGALRRENEFRRI